MTTEKRKLLEEKVSESQEFFEIFDFFMTNFAEQTAFIDQSKKIKVPIIKELISTGAAAVFQKIPIQITNLLLLNHERLGILHGNGWVEGKLFNFFYCKRINQGMLAISFGKNTQMVRISPKPTEPIQMQEDFIESVADFSKHFKHKFPN
jgi:hypothetical protein